MSLPTIEAAYFDGRSARRHGVSLRVADGMLHIDGELVARAEPIGTLRVSEPMGRAPRLVTLSDGAFCEVRDHAALAALLTATGHRESSVVQAQFDLPKIALALVAVLGLLVFAYLEGLPWLAGAVAARIPATVAGSVGDQTLETLDRALLRPSRLPEVRRKEILARLAAMSLPGAETLPHRLEFRSSKWLGANAWTLPGGRVVITDELVTLAADDDEIIAVLGHELGHVRGEHPLRLSMQATIVGLLATWYLGDVSSLAASAPAAVLAAHYSRDMEREADAYAVAFMRANGIAPERLASMLLKMEALARKSAAGQDGDRTSDYLSSHPATRERLEFLRRGGVQ